MKYNVYKPTDLVKVCNRNICIEARGVNATAIVNAVCFVAFCVGIAALLKTSK